MMNIRGKSSPVQSSVRNLPNQTRGPTPPPASQLRGFEEQPQFHTHYQPAANPYQQSQQAYLDMNKSVAGRVPGGAGLAQTHQGYSMPRGGQHGFQHFPPPRRQNGNQNYGLMGDSQEPPAPQMWNQGAAYYQIPNQNRMPMSNAPVAYLPGMASNMPNMAGNMAIFSGAMPAPGGYNGNQAIPFMQNHHAQSQFMYSQPRMPFATQMPQQQQQQQQQQQMRFMPPQYGPTSTPYPTQAFYGQPPMSLPTNSRPPSAGPQGAMGGGGHKPQRSRKMLSLRDPNTGEDLTEKVFKPVPGEETEPSALESQAHREKVHLEFATKVAFLAKDKHQHSVERSHAIDITPPPLAPPQQPGPPEPVQQQQHMPVRPLMEDLQAHPPSHPLPPPSGLLAPLHSLHEPPPPLAHTHTVPVEPLVMNGEAESGSMEASNVSMAASVNMAASNVGMVASNISMAASNVSMAASNDGMVASNISMVASNVSMAASNDGMVASNISMAASNVSTVASNVSMQLSEPPPVTPPFSIPPPAAQPEFQPAEEIMASAAAAAEVQTLSPALPSAAPVVVPEVAAAPAPSPVKEVSPPPPSKEPTPPPTVVETTTTASAVVEVKEEEMMSPPPEPEAPTAPAVSEKEPTSPPADSAALVAPSDEVVSPPLQVTSVIAVEAAKVIAEAPSVPAQANKAAQMAAEASKAPQSQDQPQTSSQAQSAAQPLPSSQKDSRKYNKKYRRELNKKNKDGNDMDAYVDTEGLRQNGSESSAKATPPPSSTSPPPTTPPPAIEVEAAEAGAAAPPAEAVSKPSTAPKAEEVQPKAEDVQPKLEEVQPKVEEVQPKVEEVQPKAEEVQVKSGRLLPDPKPPVSAAAPEPSPAEPQPAAKASKEATQEASDPAPVPTPTAEEEVTSEEATKPEGAEDEDDAQKEDVEETYAEYVDKLADSMGIKYKEGQWSPMNQDGKKQYDREFLLKLQANPESQKPPMLPHMPEITIDPKLIRTDEFRQRVQMSTNTNIPDFTPGFFRSSLQTHNNNNRQHQQHQQQPSGSMTKRGSQQRGRVGPSSQSGEQRIILSHRQEVQLHKSENAYKPQFQAGPKQQVAPDDEQETQSIMRRFQSILNKLTPEKFNRLIQQALELKVDSEDRLTGITNLIFEKALSEQKFASVYAEFCYQLQKIPKMMMPIPEEDIKEEDKGKEDKKYREVTFRGVLLTKCQREFEKEKEAEKQLEQLQQQMDQGEGAFSGNEQQRKVLKDELEQAIKKARYRTLGNIKFIGELFRLKMLTETIMHDCIFKLLKLREDDSIECLTKLLEVVGKDLDHQKAKKRMDQYFALMLMLFQQRMDQYFAQLDKMVAEMKLPQGAQPPPPVVREGKNNLSSRVKFFIRDILDLRKNGWVKRKIHDQNQPTTLEAIHQKAKQEEQAQQFLNSQPRQESSSGRGGARPKGRGSAQGDADGWNTVPARQVKQQIEPTRMKLTKTNVDVNNVNLGGGNKFRNWGQGSQGGGSHSQEQEKQGNRYNALNTLNDNDGHRSLGRSPARGVGGSSRMASDRNFRKPVGRSSMEDRERAMGPSRNMMGAAGSSNPSSRNGSRDNSRSREAPPAKVSGVDASKMSRDELDRRINTIAEEFVSNGSYKDTQESIAELRNLNYSMLVTTLMEKLIEKGGGARKMLGQLLMHLVRERRLSIDDLITGLKEFLQYAEDLELDVPRIWDYLAEVLGALVVDHKVLPLTFLQPCLATLVAQGHQKEVTLLSKTLKLAAEYKTKEVVQAQWAASGLKLSEFGLSESDFKWLKGPARNMVHQEVLQRLKRNEKNERIYVWIDENVSKEDRMSPQFVREFFSAICRHIIVGNGSEKPKLNTEEMKYRVPLVRRYVDTTEKGTQALFGIQHLMCELEHPQDLARILFEMCYDEDMISEDSFYDWESHEGPPEDNVGKGVVKLSTRDFFNWLRSGPEDERTS